MTYILILWIMGGGSTHAPAMVQIPGFASREKCEYTGQQFEHSKGASLREDRSYICLEVQP